MAHPETGRTVPSDRVRRGIEVERGRFVLLEDAELAELEPEPSRRIEVVRFVPAAAIDHRWYERPYYLGPDQGQREAYFALAASLEHREQEGVARWTMRKRGYAGALRLHAGYLALVSLRSSDEVIEARELEAPGGRELEPRELELASQLIASLTGTFRHEQFRDEYRERVLDLVSKKQRGRKIDLVRYKSRATGEQSLVDALRRSLKSAG
jgi:DNA end-binding protein Ku